VDDGPCGTSGAIFTAVCAGLVVAPPMSSGTVKPARFISFATCTISSSDGVMRPERPMTSTAPFSRATARDLVARHHDAEVDHLVIVAGEDDADDVLADVVDVALDGGHEMRPWARGAAAGDELAFFSSSMNGVR
jgi:hypothetical protein